MAETSADPPAPAAAAEPAPSDTPKAEPQRKQSKRKSSLKKEAVAAAAAEGGEEATAEASAPATDGDSAPGAAGGAEGEAVTASATTGETVAPPKAVERKASRRKSSLKKPPARQASMSKKEGEQLDTFEDDEEEQEPKIIYPIDPKIQEILRKAWSLFIKKGQKKKTEIAELDIPTVMRSIAINPLETQVKEVIAYTKSQDVTTTSKGFLTYDCFEQRMAESFHLEPNKYVRNSKERILAALHTISAGTNEVNAAELKKIMMTKGDVMTEQEAALMIRNVGDRDTGKVYVDEYADMLSKDGLPQPPPDPTVW